MFAREIATNRFLLHYAQMLLSDIGDERLTEQPLPGVNHPAWILGHLAYSGDLAVGALGGTKTLPADWPTRFGAGSKPTSTRSDYPAKAELLEILEERYQQARDLAATAAPERMALPNPNARMRPGLPTLGDACTFLLAAHPAVHLGQLSMWRRMIGLPALF